MRKIKEFLFPLLLHPKLRWWVGRIRFFYFIKIRRRLKIFESPYAVKNTISHNLEAFEHIKIDFSMRRMEFLIHGLLSIEYLPKDARILIIGPRTENDLLIFRGNGYHNIIGLDLISYSPWVKLGDMHNTPFEDSSFDAVVSAWCITYSKTPKIVITETIRILKPNGISAIGLDYWPLNEKQSREITAQKKGRIEFNPKRLQTTAELKQLFAKKINKVFLEYDAPFKPAPQKEPELSGALGSSQVMLINSIIKQ
jgi:SAM-dependent methyltransferase